MDSMYPELATSDQHRPWEKSTPLQVSQVSSNMGVMEYGVIIEGQ
jgi:hypothetical protein